MRACYRTAHDSRRDLELINLCFCFAARALRHHPTRGAERYLEGKFGDEYRRYKTKIPRYWWRFSRSGYTTTTSGSCAREIMKVQLRQSYCSSLMSLDSMVLMLVGVTRATVDLICQPF